MDRTIVPEPKPKRASLLEDQSRFPLRNEKKQ
jgi:hypothetical protein